MIKCTRCGKVREERYIVMRKSKYNGKVRARCRARSTCSSRARRRNNVTRGE